MSNDNSAASPATTESAPALAAAHDASQCLALAAAADAAGDVELNRACLQRAVALDRQCQPALLGLAALSLDEGDTVSTFSFVEEAARIAPLPASVEPLREQLFAAVRNLPEVDFYLRAIGRTPGGPAEKKLSVVIVMSGDELPELTRALSARGHEVRVVAVDATKNPRDNAARIRTAVAKSAADLVLALNLGAVDVAVLRPALERSVPVLHWMAEARPSFAVDDQPRDEHYWIAPASDWTGTALRNAGYETARMDTLYSGVAIDRGFRLFLPDTQRLRITCACSLLPGKGADTVLRALAQLHGAGLDFSADIASVTTDDLAIAKWEAFVREAGLEGKVRFVSAADEAGRAALLARNNVLVLATRSQESFDFPHVEALIAGLVVVSSGACGGKEFIRDQTDGLIFADGDAADLAAKLTQLAGDSELMQRLQRQGQARAMAFSLEKTVAKIETLAGELHAALEAARVYAEAPLA